MFVILCFLYFSSFSFNFDLKKGIKEFKWWRIKFKWWKQKLIKSFFYKMISQNNIFIQNKTYIEQNKQTHIFVYKNFCFRYFIISITQLSLIIINSKLKYYIFWFSIDINNL